jgi:hypothetical protein
MWQKITRIAASSVAKVTTSTTIAESAAEIKAQEEIKALKAELLEQKRRKSPMEPAESEFPTLGVHMLTRLLHPLT